MVSVSLILPLTVVGVSIRHNTTASCHQGRHCWRCSMTSRSNGTSWTSFLSSLASTVSILMWGAFFLNIKAVSIIPVKGYSSSDPDSESYLWSSELSSPDTISACQPTWLPSSPSVLCNDSSLLLKIMRESLGCLPLDPLGYSTNKCSC